MTQTGRVRVLKNFRFRVAAPSDEPVLAEMLYLAVFVSPGTPPPDPSIVKQPELSLYVRGWGRPGDDGVIAVAPRGHPIGAAWVRLWSEDEHGYAFVDVQTPELSVAVRSEFRGRGIGTHLLRQILCRVDETYGSVSLSVSVLNPAVQLYEKLGFAKLLIDGTSMTMRRMRGTGSCEVPIGIKPGHRNGPVG